MMTTSCFITGLITSMNELGELGEATERTSCPRAYMYNIIIIVYKARCAMRSRTSDMCTRDLGPVMDLNRTNAAQYVLIRILCVYHVAINLADLRNTLNRLKLTCISRDERGISAFARIRDVLLASDNKSPVMRIGYYYINTCIISEGRNTMSLLRKYMRT